MKRVRGRGEGGAGGKGVSFRRDGNVLEMAAGLRIFVSNLREKRQRSCVL